jgi:SAM-dependent methyltransferase
MSEHMEGGGQPYFEALHEVVDPFGYRSRWYEVRKRQLLLATLPRMDFDRGWEIGCSNGELTFVLSSRCHHLLATDIADNAVLQAAARLRGVDTVQVQRMDHPAQWPEGSFDLIVLSEVGYYLRPSELADTIEKLEDSLTPNGLLLACHWLHPFAEAFQDGREVHQQLARMLGIPPLYRYEDSDFVLEAWGGGDASIAQLEGLR